jgi:hypothetical protein
MQSWWLQPSAQKAHFLLLSGGLNFHCPEVIFLEDLIFNISVGIIKTMSVYP